MGEWDNKDTVFPHAVRGRPPEDLYYDDLRRTPFADELIFAAALDAMAAHELGADEDTDLLAVGFSATDSIGHTYGADSQEVMDQLLRLDRTLQALFEELERRVGLSRGLVVLSADHGVLPLVDRVYTHADLMGEPPVGDPEFRLFRNAFFQPRSAHLVTRLKPYVYIGSYVGRTSHGTVHDYDRHVPVVFMGAGVKPGSYDVESGPEDIAPTLSALLGLDYPEQDGRTLTEITR